MNILPINGLLDIVHLHNFHCPALPCGLALWRFAKEHTSWKSRDRSRL